MYQYPPYCIVCQCESGKKVPVIALCVIERHCESGKKKYPPSSGQKRKSIRDGEWRTRLESKDLSQITIFI